MRYDHVPRHWRNRYQRLRFVTVGAAARQNKGKNTHRDVLCLCIDFFTPDFQNRGPVSKRRADMGATDLDPSLDIFAGIYKILREATNHGEAHGGSRGAADTPELLRYKYGQLPTAKPTLDKLNKEMSARAWAWCVVWLKRRQSKGQSSSSTDAPVEWLSATELEVLCT